MYKAAGARGGAKAPSTEAFKAEERGGSWSIDSPASASLRAPLQPLTRELRIRACSGALRTKKEPTQGPKVGAQSRIHNS